jgi:hypothetical protein
VSAGGVQVLVEKYFLFGCIPMFFGFCLIGRSPVKIPETGFGRRAMIGHLVITPVGGIKGMSADLTFDLGFESFPGSVYNVHVGTVFSRIRFTEGYKSPPHKRSFIHVILSEGICPD